MSESRRSRVTRRPLTGRELRDWLNARPENLDRPVHLLVMVGDEEDSFATTVEVDVFDEDEGVVISILAEGTKETA